MPKKYTFLLCVVVVSVGFFTIYPTLGVKQWVKSISQREVQSEDKLVLSKSADADNEGIPEFDKDNIQSKGIVLFFKNWPLSLRQENLILKKTKAENLKSKKRYWIFKAWSFSLDKWYPVNEARKVCEKFKDIAFLESCFVNTPEIPAAFFNKRHKKNKRKISVAYNDISQNFSFDSKQSGFLKKQNLSIRNCRVVSETSHYVKHENNHYINQNYIKEGTLSKYWAQMRIGADLSKSLLLSDQSNKKKQIIQKKKTKTR